LSRAQRSPRATTRRLALALQACIVLSLGACAAGDGFRLDPGGLFTSSANPAADTDTIAALATPWDVSDDLDGQVVDPGDSEADDASADFLDDSLLQPTLKLELSLAEEQDLWERARNQLALDIAPNRRITRELDWYLRNQAYLDRVADRARLYLHHVVGEVERRGLPGELAFLPVVESAYQPFAYSPARASGIWQFIPSTGRLYGLRRSWWYDGRRDVVESTRAALDYLEKLHAEFSGDWLLALAAYNSGEGNVHKAIRKNRKRGKPTDFWSLQLPRETRSYVPRLLAVAAIVADPDAHGMTLKPIPDEPYFASTSVDGQIDLALAAKMAEVSLDELYLLNPGFSRWATDPDGPHRILLPVDAVPGFEERLSQLPAEQRIQWRRHVVKRGDTLGTLARHYRTSVVALKQVNGLRGTTIREGHSLIVPQSSRSLADYRLSVDMRKAMRRRAPGSGQKVVYRVRRGDSLWRISLRYGVSVNKLAAWNGLSKRSILRPGQRLVIYRGKAPAVASTPAVSKVASSTPTADGNTTSHVVRSGDNLWTISRRYGVSSRNLARWNGIDPGELLQPGQTLTLKPSADGNPGVPGAAPGGPGTI
jgi:membrane-bound lytic murein transglycosylase D